MSVPPPLLGALKAFDDATLETLAPKGLVRRARRDQETGLGAILSSTVTEVSLMVDGQTVVIDSSGPSKARCTCPAVGICRHILTAIMVANNVEDATDSQDSFKKNDVDLAPPLPSAIDDLVALTPAALKRYAGADWEAAISLATTSQEATIQTIGSNLTIHLGGAAEPVTFIAGQGLAGAGYKGSKSRARVLITAAAIKARLEQGIAIADREAHEEAEVSPSLSVDWLEEVSAEIVEATGKVLGGTPAIGEAILFDLSISARAQAAPRLTRLLRTLSSLAGLAKIKSIHFEQSTFLVEVASAFALTLALRHSPTDLALIGSLRRTFEVAPAAAFHVLSAQTWNQVSGARGLSIYMFDENAQLWRALTQARNVGMDPAFVPERAYQQSIWALASPQDLMGKIIELETPMVASDNSLGLTLPCPARASGAIPNLQALLACGAFADSASQLIQSLATQYGTGLRQTLTSRVGGIIVSGFSKLVFEPFSQTYQWTCFDKTGQVLPMYLPADGVDVAEKLVNRANEIKAMVVACEELNGAIIFKPLTVLMEHQPLPRLINLNLDAWPRTQKDGFVGFFKRGLSAGLDLVQPSSPHVPRPSLIVLTCDKAIDAACAVVAGSHMTQTITDAQRACEECGLFELASALGRMQTKSSPAKAALAVAWIGSQIKQKLIWQS